jgi:protein-tyrosine phosphatase
MSASCILVLGAADTGRAPMTAALLRRLAAQRGLNLSVASAGVVGHDDDPAEPEARAAMRALGLEIDAHQARSLSAELVASAQLLLAVEAGVARVARARFPEATIRTLGELAGRPRDIPDPFRMQMGAWVQYAGEIEALLSAGMPQLIQLLAASHPEPAPAPPPAAPSPPAAPPQPLLVAAEGREAQLAQAERLLALAAELPAVLNWPAARAQLAASLSAIETPLLPTDLARPYLATLRVMLQLAADALPIKQAQALRTAFHRLRGPIGPYELEALSRDLAHFQG